MSLAAACDSARDLRQLAPLKEALAAALCPVPRCQAEMEEGASMSWRTGQLAPTHGGVALEATDVDKISEEPDDELLLAALLAKCATPQLHPAPALHCAPRHQNARLCR